MVGGWVFAVSSHPAPPPASSPASPPAGAEEPQTRSASDKASGMTVSIAGDQVTLKRSSVERVRHRRRGGPDLLHRRLHQARRRPRRSPRRAQPWYAATLITWPDKAKTTTATLSHSSPATPTCASRSPATSRPRSSCTSSPDIKATIEKQQIDHGSATSRPPRPTQRSRAPPRPRSAALRRQVPRRGDADAGADGTGPLRQDAPTRPPPRPRPGRSTCSASDTTDKQLVLSIKGADGKVTHRSRRRPPATRSLNRRVAPSAEA